MYSQCPKCHAIFSVSDTEIGAHHGLVRCGHCSSIFHALNNEVSDVGGRSEDRAPETRDEIESSPSEPIEAGHRAVPGAEDPGEAAGAPPEYDQDRRPEAGHTADVQEDAAREWPIPEPGDLDRDYPDEALIEPELPEAPEPPADATPEPPPASTPEKTPESPSADTSREQRWRDDTGLPGEITEEITIEAPPVLWNVFDEETEEEADTDEAHGGGNASTARGAEQDASPTGRPGRAPPAAETRAVPGGAGPAPRTPTPSRYRDRDVRMVELPQPQPFKTATLSLLTGLLALLLVWQAKTFYLDELAQLPVLRPFLERLCQPLGCVLPPRSDFARIDLVGTSIDVNPAVPGALEIKVSVINRAHFPQPYPPLRVTLTDREGRIVGQRTYLPSEYRGEDKPELLPIKEVRNVSINLAQPAENAVGYEVELMTPVQEGDD